VAACLLWKTSVAGLAKANQKISPERDWLDSSSLWLERHVPVCIAGYPLHLSGAEGTQTGSTEAQHTGKTLRGSADKQYPEQADGRQNGIEPGH
jgi:hypothetical protein